MTKKEKIVWRLSKLPSVSEVSELVNNKIITQEEAREILLNKEEYEDRDVKSYQEEIKFLREMIDLFIKSRADSHSIVYKYIETTPYHGTWTQPYITWTTTASSGNGSYNSGLVRLSTVNTF